MKKEEKIQLIKKFFNICFIFLLLTFLGLYISQSTGYYDYEQYKKKVLTEEKIKQFEKDVKEGKNLSLENYLENHQVNYQNKISRLGQTLSYNIGKYVKYGINKTFKLLNDFLDDS